MKKMRILGETVMFMFGTVACVTGGAVTAIGVVTKNNKLIIAGGATVVAGSAVLSKHSSMRLRDGSDIAIDTLKEEGLIKGQVFKKG